VWEETIILLPDNVHYVFLSATIPNARQFAEWIAHLHKQVQLIILFPSQRYLICRKRVLQTVTLQLWTCPNSENALDSGLNSPESLCQVLGENPLLNSASLDPGE